MGLAAPPAGERGPRRRKNALEWQPEVKGLCHDRFHVCPFFLRGVLRDGGKVCRWSLE